MVKDYEFETALKWLKIKYPNVDITTRYLYTHRKEICDAYTKNIDLVELDNWMRFNDLMEVETPLDYDIYFSVAEKFYDQTKKNVQDVSFTNGEMIQKLKEITIHHLQALHNEKSYIHEETDALSVDLTDFLAEFDFEYIVLDEKTFRVKDLHGTNWGGLDDVSFELSKEGVSDLCDCFVPLYADKYFNQPDGLIPYRLKNNYGIDVDEFSSWKEMYDTYVSLDIANKDDIVECIFNPDLITIDKEYEREH